MNNPFYDIDRAILADAFTSDESEQVLLALCDDIGIRFSGTEGEKKAAEYIAGKFEEYGLDTVEIEEFSFDAWRRGPQAGLDITGQYSRAIPSLSLPYGAPTGESGVSGTLVDIGAGSPDEIEKLKDKIRGSIIITDATAVHRSEIYGRVVEAGAIGFVMRGRAPGMMLPTGCVSFGACGKIPAIGSAYESGLLLQRLAGREELTVRLHTHDTFEKGTSRNVYGEIRGAKTPDELVLTGGHMDSHDVAPGAVDNASGTTCVVEAARLLSLQKTKLERTIRFLGFGSEEVGLLGSYHHADAHSSELPSVRFMLNLDCLIMSRPKGLVFHNLPGAADYARTLRGQMREPLPLYERIHPHSDHFPFVLKGVPTGEIGGGNFDPKVRAFAHMAGDTPDKVSLMDLREESALAARLLFRASNDPEWPFQTRTPDEVANLLEESGIKDTLEYEHQNKGE